MRFNNKNQQVSYTPTPISLKNHYLTFEPLENNSTLRFTESSEGNRYVQYSIDNGNTWENLGDSYRTFNIGDKIICRGAFTDSGNWQNTPRFQMNAGKWKVSGEISSLLYTDNNFTSRKTEIPVCGFSMLFYEQALLYDVSELSFDGVLTGAGSSMAKMFYGCYNITSITFSDYTDGVDSNIYYMFYGCSNLSYIAFQSITNVSQTGDFTWGCPASGTFVKKAGVYWPAGSSGIPSGWTVVEV